MKIFSLLENDDLCMDNNVDVNVDINSLLDISSDIEIDYNEIMDLNNKLLFYTDSLEVVENNNTKSKQLVRMLENKSEISYEYISMEAIYELLSIPSDTDVVDFLSIDDIDLGIGISLEKRDDIFSKLLDTILKIIKNILEIMDRYIKKISVSFNPLKISKNRIDKKLSEISNSNIKLHEEVVLPAKTLGPRMVSYIHMYKTYTNNTKEVMNVVLDKNDFYRLLEDTVRYLDRKRTKTYIESVNTLIKMYDIFFYMYMDGRLQLTNIPGDDVKDKKYLVILNMMENLRKNIEKSKINPIQNLSNVIGLNVSDNFYRYIAMSNIGGKIDNLYTKYSYLMALKNRNITILSYGKRTCLLGYYVPLALEMERKDDISQVGLRTILVPFPDNPDIYKEIDIKSFTTINEIKTFSKYIDNLFNAMKQYVDIMNSSRRTMNIDSKNLKKMIDKAKNTLYENDNDLETTRYISRIILNHITNLMRTVSTVTNTTIYSSFKNLLTSIKYYNYNVNLFEQYVNKE